MNEQLSRINNMSENILGSVLKVTAVTVGPILASLLKQALRNRYKHGLSYSELKANFAALRTIEGVLDEVSRWLDRGLAKDVVEIGRDFMKERRELQELVQKEMSNHQSALVEITDED